LLLGFFISEASEHLPLLLNIINHIFCHCLAETQLMARR
jgi:hypothetical protein